MTCSNSYPHEKKNFHTLVRCKITGASCATGKHQDHPCLDPEWTKRNLK